MHSIDHAEEDPAREDLVKDDTAENKAENKGKSNLISPKAIESPLKVAELSSTEPSISLPTILDRVVDFNQKNELCSQIRTY